MSLVYANVKEEDILMKKELDIQARVHGRDKFALHYVLNEPPSGAPPPPSPLRGRPRPPPSQHVLFCFRLRSIWSCAVSTQPLSLQSETWHGAQHLAFMRTRVD